MKKRTISLVLALVLVIGLLAGCAKSEPTADTEQPTEESAAESAAAPEPAAEAPAQTAEEAASEAPAPVETAEEPAPDDPAPVETAEEPAPAVAESEEPAPEEPRENSPSLFEGEVNVSSDIVIDYPLSDGSESIAFWVAFSGMLNDFGQTYVGFPGVEAYQEQTGVRLDFIEVSESASTEQYQLMIASGDWPDLSNTSNYTGGVVTAYDEEVIMDLTDLVPEYAPDMWKYTAALPDDIYAGMFKDGRILGGLNIEYNGYQDEGTVLRGDWLEEQDWDVPTNFDELLDVMYMFYDVYHPNHTYKLSTDAGMVGMQGVFGTAFANLDPSNGSLTMFLRDGKVVNAGTDDNYYEYLKMLTQLYADGLIYPDFYSEGRDMSAGMAMAAGGQAGVWSDRANNVEEVYSYVTDDDNYNLVALPYFTGEDGTNNFVNSPYRVGTDYGIYTTCDKPELVLNFLNYAFTDEGILLCNYGIEGVSFEYDEDGKPQFTDTILHPAVGNSNTINQYYGWTLTGRYEDKQRLLVLYDEYVNDIIDLWNDWDVLGWSANIPDAASLDTAEQNQVTNHVSDMTTIQTEYLLGFVTGSRELNDETWQEYLDLMESSGLSDVLAVYQGAYDDYLAELDTLR